MATAYQCLNDAKNPEIAINNAQVQKERHRELVIEVPSANKQFAFLKFKDHQHTWYNIPLGRVSTRKRDAPSLHNNILVPVVPRCYCTVDLNPKVADVPRENGYIYIFKGDYLWRELKVLARGTFKEINLHHYQGLDVREATVETDTRILLPYKIEGTSEVISMCFSEIQWSWARINAMGGMDKKDIRYDGSKGALRASDIRISKSMAEKNRKARMQEIDLSGYDSGFPVTPPKGNKARIENVEQASVQAYHMKLHHKSKIPVVYLHDPLGIAMSNVQYYYDALTYEINVAKKHEYFKSAVPAYHAFFNQDLWDATKRGNGRNSYTIYKKQGDGPELLRKVAKLMDKNQLREILKVERRKKLRKVIRECKTIHVEWLEGKYKGNPLSSSCSDYVSVNAALLDYAELPAPAYIVFWSALHALIHFIGTDPSSVDGGLDLMTDIDGPKRDDDLGVKYLNSLLEPSHPLHKAAFPSKAQIDEFSEKYKYKGKAPEPPNGKGEFRPAAFAACMAPTFARREAWKAYDDVIKTAERIVVDIINLYKQQWQQAMAGKTTMDATVLVRLMKAGNFPDLKGLHLIKPGTKLANMIVVSGNVSVFAHLSALQAQSLVTKEPQTGYIKVVDPISKETIGYMDPTQLPNNKGAPVYIDKKMWDGLFRNNTNGVATARSTLMVVANDSRYAQEWHMPGSTGDDKITKTVKGVQFAGKVLPPAVAVMEVFNLASLVSDIFVRKKWEKSPQAVVAF